MLEEGNIVNSAIPAHTDEKIRFLKSQFLKISSRLIRPLGPVYASKFRSNFRSENLTPTKSPTQIISWYLNFLK